MLHVMQREVHTCIYIYNHYYSIISNRTAIAGNQCEAPIARGSALREWLWFLESRGHGGEGATAHAEGDVLRQIANGSRR